MEGNAEDHHRMAVGATVARHIAVVEGGIARAELGYVRNPKGGLQGEAVECCRTERRGVAA